MRFTDRLAAGLQLSVVSQLDNCTARGPTFIEKVLWFLLRYHVTLCVLVAPESIFNAWSIRQDRNYRMVASRFTSIDGTCREYGAASPYTHTNSVVRCTWYTPCYDTKRSTRPYIDANYKDGLVRLHHDCNVRTACPICLSLAPISQVNKFRCVLDSRSLH